jgi:two-component system response regulator AtoC
MNRRGRNSSQRAAAKTSVAVDEALGQSEAFLSFQERLSLVAPIDRPVLLIGERGTGKELAASRLHYLSKRWQGPLVALNCAALNPSLIESELFGYEKGAFTGAYRQKPGKFELADGGTIFLDEIGDISPSLQVKLLQVLQDREFSRLGGKKDIKVNVRILVATNRNVEEAVVEGRFREDLYYRLNVVNITVPPLRERREEIPVLIEYFLNKFAEKYQKKLRPISDSAMKTLSAHHWPGNIRELQNVIQRYVVLGNEEEIIAELSGSREKDDLPHYRQEELNTLPAHSSLKQIHREAARRAEARVITEALEMTHYNRKKAAQLLNISYKSLLYKIKDCRIDKTLNKMDS